MSAAEQLASVELSTNAMTTHNLILRAVGLSSVDKAVLWSMATRIGAAGSRWATHEAMAREAGCARSTLQAALARLEEQGRSGSWLPCHAFRETSGAHLANPKNADAPDCRPERRASTNRDREVKTNLASPRAFVHSAPSLCLLSVAIFAGEVAS